MPKTSKKKPVRSSRLPDLTKYLTKKRLITIGIATSLILNVMLIGVMATAVTQSMRGNITSLSAGYLWQFTCSNYFAHYLDKYSPELGPEHIINGATFVPIYLTADQQKNGCNTLAMADQLNFKQLLLSNNSQAIDYYVKTTNMGKGKSITIPTNPTPTIYIKYDAVSKQPLNIEDTAVVY